MFLCLLMAIILNFVKRRKVCCKRARVYNACFVTASMLLIAMLSVSFIALRHGADFEALTKLNTVRIVKAIINSPVACSRNDIDKEGNIILYYRFGCKDCEAVFEELDKIVKENSCIYWVATRSQMGKCLLEKYLVSDVPSGVVIQEDDDYTQYVLYQENSVDEESSCDIILDRDAFNRLLILQKRELEEVQNVW